MPPVHEIVASLKQGEEIAQFLQHQTKFWMEQVKLIEHAHSHGGGASAGSVMPTWALPPGIGSALLTGAAPSANASGSAPATQTAPAVPASSAPSTAPVCSAAPAVSAEASSATPSTPTSPSKEEAPAGGSDHNAQMSELQKLQKERWLQRSSSNLGEGEEGDRSTQ